MAYAKLPHPCVDCGKAVNNQGTRCSRCGKTRARANNPEGYKARKARQRKKKRDSGMCVRCGNFRKSKLYCADCLQLLRESIQKEREALRKEVLEHYGAKCDICGNNVIEFLTIDHINGGGNKHRKAIKASGINLYRWLRSNAYPVDFRVLCINCNWGIGIYGEHHIREIVG